MNETAVASFPTYGKAIIAVLATTVSTATLGGNVVVLMAFIVESSVRIPSNYFIASLAVTDVLIGLFSMNLFISYQLLGYWPLSQLICNIWLTLDFSACLTSQYTVFLITLDRYCSVKIPMSYQSWRTLAKVRWMICLSWILPAVLFTTLIMGWKQITGEPPRAEGKCDVSFTYYPVFNTTLIVGYFWTTLIVMCSLYVGIYKVARRLQKKAQAKGSTFAALFNMGEKENDEEEDPSDEAMRQPTVTKCVKQGPLIAADSGYRGSNTPLEVPVDGICGNQSGKRISMQKTITEDCQRDILLPNNVTNEDLSSLYSPLKTSEDICKLRSPQDLEISETLSQSSQTSTSGNDKVTLLEQLSVRHSKNNDREETNLGCLHQPGRENERCKDDSLTYRESKINGIKRSDFTDIDPIFRPKIFYCECEKKLDKYEQSSDLRSPENLIHENSTSSDSPSSIPSIIPVKKFVPSPKVPISVPAEGGQTESIKANHNYSAQSRESPVWVANNTPKKQECHTFFCPQCMQIVSCTLPKGYKYVKPLHQIFYVKPSAPVAARETEYIQCSPTKTVNFSDFSSSGQNDSWEQNCELCGCRGMYGQEAFGYTSTDTTESDTSSYPEEPWYRRKFPICFGRTVFYRVRTTGVRRSRSVPSRNFSVASAKPIFRDKFNRISCKIRRIGPKLSHGSHVSHIDENKRPSKLSLAKSETPTEALHSRGSVGHARSLSQESNNRRHARKALRTISFILGAFMLCWIPYHIIMVIKGFCDDLSTQTSCVSQHLYNLSYWLCYMNSPINPFCYALSNALFRRTFFRILRGNFERR